MLVCVLLLAGRITPSPLNIMESWVRIGRPGAKLSVMLQPKVNHTSDNTILRPLEGKSTEVTGVGVGDREVENGWTALPWLGSPGLMAGGSVQVNIS